MYITISGQSKGLKTRQAEEGDMSLARVQEGIRRMLNPTSSVPYSEPFSLLPSWHVSPGYQKKYTATVFTLYLLQAEIFPTSKIKEAKTVHKAIYYLTKPGRCSWDRWQIDRATLASSPCFSLKQSWGSGPWCKCSSPPWGWTPVWLIWDQSGLSSLEEWRLFSF